MVLVGGRARVYVNVYGGGKVTVDTSNGTVEPPGCIILAAHLLMGG